MRKRPLPLSHLCRLTFYDGFLDCDLVLTIINLNKQFSIKLTGPAPVSYTFNLKTQKKDMKKIITSALMLALTIGAVQAQSTSTEKGNDHRREQRMDKFEGLNLTADQKAKLKLIREEQKKEMQVLKGNKSVTQEQREALHKKYREQMESVLTADQKQQLAKMKEERKASAKKGDFKNGSGRKGDFKRSGDFEKELGLTQEQKDKMAKIRADYRSQFETVRNDNSLTKEQKKTKMHDLMKAQQEQMKTVLTKEQIEKMQSLKKDRSSKNTK